MTAGHYEWLYGDGLPCGTRFVSVIIAAQGLSVEKLATALHRDAVRR